MDAYDAARANDREPRPDLPLKENGQVHISKMKKMVRELGYSIPCEICKIGENPKFCCHESSIADCEHFELFEDSRPRTARSTTSDSDVKQEAFQ
ncbi:hypothetical protein PEBR_25786 [Penicillium brasilianum]|uniref:Uncharacterized protein n=1 Tax=Penicillium brasilianum TaxID=104259 RepID=A0A1S9RJR6_PENBI|nr:hypothetical protein PEBR_25786 [Penicillium brasilianum]